MLCRTQIREVLQRYQEFSCRKFPTKVPRQRDIIHNLIILMIKSEIKILLNFIKLIFIRY